MSITKSPEHQPNQPQPAVGQNTGSHASCASSGNPFLEGVADVTPPPAGIPVSAGGRVVLPRLMIDQDGSLWIGDDADPARHHFTQPQVEALGDFLRLTEPLWRH